MLSIHALGHGQQEYYLKLSQEDYYLRGTEPPGRWLGSGADWCGVSGTVKPDDFRRLFNGFDPAGYALVQNAGSENRQPGWDLTFTVPKDVSVVWAMSGGGTRAEVEKAHAAAVAAAMGYLEDDFAWSRRGKGGIDKDRCGLVAAAFEHGTSREQDCNLHTHVIVMNVGVRPDGTTGTILTKPLYESKLAAGALYRAELAHQLQQRLGLACEAEKSWFKLSGVPKEVNDEFSTRRKQIEAALNDCGQTGAKAAEAAALATRRAKESRSREELFGEWKRRGQALGFGPDQAANLTAAVRPAEDPTARLRVILPQAVHKLTEAKSHVTERDVIRATAEAIQAEGVSATVIRDTVREYLERAPDIVRLGVRDDLPRFTTKELYAIEQKLLDDAKRVAGDVSKNVPQSAVALALAARPFLSAEQVAAVTHLTRGTGGVRVVNGLAGTGKTTMLQAAREAWEGAGMTVIGAALAGKAAQGLQDGALIPSETIHSRLYALDKGRMKLGPKSVVVVDEAGMVGTRLLARLVDHVLKADALLVLVGDYKQLQSVDAGGVFKSLGDRLGRAELTNITRQKEEWARQAVHAVVEGEAGEALRAFAERGLLTVAQDRPAAMRELVEAWRAGGCVDPSRHLILAGTNDEAARLNRLCQSARQAAGLVAGSGVHIGADTVQAGDRVLFTRNDRSVGVKNGSLATVLVADPALQTLRVRLDKGPDVIVPLQTYDHLKLGYAVTTHKGQGVTVDHCYVLAGGLMTDRESSYVQLSRARRSTRVFVDRGEAGEDLVRAMAKSRLKDLAHDVSNRPEPLTYEAVR